MLCRNAVLLLSLYVVLFGSTFITNKYVLTIEKFSYPAIFQSWQVFVAALGFSLTTVCCQWQWHTKCLIMTVQNHWKTIPFYTMSIYSGSRALTVLPISLFLAIHNALLLMHCGVDLDMGKQSIFFSSNPKDLIAFTSVAVSSIMLVTTVPRGFGNAMWWMLLHICCTGVVFAVEKISAYCAKTDAFNRQMFYYASSFLLLLPTSYFLGDFHAVQRYPYLASASFCWTFVGSGILGCFLAMVYPSVLNLELVNFNITGLAKVVVSTISVLSFGVPAVPRDYLFWTALSLVAGIFVPRRSAPIADNCTFAQADHALEHI